MKKVLKIFGILLTLIVLILIGLEVQSIRMNSSHTAEQFAAGVLPDPIPNGFIKGTARFYTGSWQGKTFDFENHRGINTFGTGENTQNKYPFETTVAKDFQNPKLDVYTLDYATSSNQFWLRPLLDEIVQIAPSQYLGKMQYRILPNHPFTLGFFELSANTEPITIRNIPITGKYFLIQLPQDWKIKFNIVTNPILGELVATSKNYSEKIEANENGAETITLTSGAKILISAQQGPNTAMEKTSETILESETVIIAGVTTTLSHINANNSKIEIYESRFVSNNNSYILKGIFDKDTFANGKQFFLDTLKSFSFPKKSN